MLRFGLLLLAAVRAAFLARTDLVVENLALRHQLSTFVPLRPTSKGRSC